MSSITANCPHCQTELEIDQELLNEVLKCPECEKEFILGTPTPKRQAPRPQSRAEQMVQSQNKSINGLGIAALVLGIIACTTCWIPYLGLLGIPVAIIGLVLGIIGWIISGVGGNSGTGMPISGTIICLVAIVIAYNVTMTTNDAIVETFDDTIDEHIQQVSEKNIVIDPSELPAGVTVKETSQQEKVKPKPEKWFNGFNGVLYDNVQISIDKATLAKVEYKDMFGELKQSSEHYIIIYLTIVNGNQNKKLNYSTWRGAMVSWGIDTAKLTDNHGNQYKRIDFSTNIPLGGVETESIYPRKAIKDILVFELPVTGTEYLHLTLPGENVGVDKIFKIEIPSNRVL